MSKSNNEERNAYAKLVKERINKFFDDLTIDEQLEMRIFTGYVDNNGKDICVGDVLQIKIEPIQGIQVNLKTGKRTKPKATYMNYEVVEYLGTYGIVMKGKDALYFQEFRTLGSLEGNKAKGFKVVGNVNENKENEK